MITEIPQSEFHERIRKVQAELARRGLDAMLTFGNEAEPQFVRYFSDYWPAFETAGVVIPVEGEPVLIIGPESLTYAQSRSKIERIRQVLQYRESSEPEYPGKPLDTLQSVFDEISSGKGVHRLAVVGYPITTVPVWESLQEAMKGGEIVRADEIVVEMRKVKSENELALLREAFRISELADRGGPGADQAGHDRDAGGGHRTGDDVPQRRGVRGAPALRALRQEQC